MRRRGRGVLLIEEGGGEGREGEGVAEGREGEGVASVENYTRPSRRGSSVFFYRTGTAHLAISSPSRPGVASPAAAFVFFMLLCARDGLFRDRRHEVARITSARTARPASGPSPCWYYFFRRPAPEGDGGGGAPRRREATRLVSPRALRSFVRRLLVLVVGFVRLDLLVQRLRARRPEISDGSRTRRRRGGENSRGHGLHELELLLDHRRDLHLVLRVGEHVRGHRRGRGRLHLLLLLLLSRLRDRGATLGP